jgi:hypothetical protein
MSTDRSFATCRLRSRSLGFDVSGSFFELNLPEIRRIKGLWFLTHRFGKVNHHWETPIDTSMTIYL